MVCYYQVDEIALQLNSYLYQTRVKLVLLWVILLKVTELVENIF